MEELDLKRQLERELEPVRLSSARRAAILEAVERQPARRTWRGPARVLLAAALACGLLGTAALALSPTLRERVNALLGEFAPYSQEVEGVSAVDQGIEIQVVRALSDENGGTVYLEATDPSGARLSETSWLDENPCLSYDGQSGSALFARSFQMEELERRGMLSEAGELILTCRQLLPALRSVEEVSLPWDLVTAEKLETQILGENDCQWDGQEPRAESTVLAPNQTQATLETELASLSSMGFDANGCFHIQLCLAESVFWSERCTLYPAEAPETDWDCAVVAEIQTVFRQNGNTYFDLCFPALTAERFGHFQVSALTGRLVVGAPVEGEWTLTFPLEQLPARTISLNEHLNGQIIEELTISAMSVRKKAVFEDPDHRTVLGYPLTVYLADGTTITAPYDDRGRTWSQTGEEIVWQLPRAVDPSEVIGVAIGQRYLPIEADDTTGPGRWLAALSE